MEGMIRRGWTVLMAGMGDVRVRVVGSKECDAARSMPNVA